MALGLLGTTGCTFSDGEPYGLVSAATLDARYELREDRDVGDGDWQKLANEMEIRLETARLSVEVVELIDAGGQLEALTFDPANPPAGYSLCHNGHCHSDSGDLVDYEDIQAELDGGGATATTALALSGGTDELLDDVPLSLDCGECSLGRGRLSRVRLSASGLSLSGEIRDGLTEPRFDGVRAFEADVSLLATEEGDIAGVLERSVSIPLDDDSASKLTLTLSVTAAASLFDGLDPADVPPDAGVTMSLDDDPTIRDAFAELELGVGVHRDDL